MHSAVTPDEYIALRTAVGWPGMAHDVAAAALRDSVALSSFRDEGGRLVGLARAIGDGFYVVIVDVMVCPAEQENGIASTLLSSLLEDPQVQRAGHLALFAAPDAVELYESFGFRAEGGTYMQRA